MNNCINIIKTSIILKKKGFIVKNSKVNINILKAFLKINVIKFIKISKNKKKLFIYINYYNNKPIFVNIVNKLKTSNKKYISLKNVKKISLKNNWIFILSTNKGILNNYEAVNNNVGGLILAEIWN